MKLNRRDVLKGAAVATAGSLTILTGARTASAATHPTLQVGSHGSQVLALQLRLSSLGYWLPGADGQFGDLTRQAVVAIQKVAGLSRDGTCGPLTWSRVDAGIRPRARSARGHVVEIAKATQTLLIVDSGVVKRIYNASTGSNQRYFQGGNGHIATTPSGTFRAFPPGERLGQRFPWQPVPPAVLQRRYRRPRLHVGPVHSGLARLLPGEPAGDGQPVGCRWNTGGHICPPLLTRSSTEALLRPGTPAGP